MTAAIYSLSAALIAALTTRAWRLDRHDPARRGFLSLGWSLALGYLAFALAFLPGLGVLRGVWTIAACVAPAYLWRVIDALFPSERPARTLERAALPAAWVVGVACALAHTLAYGPTTTSSTPENVAGLFTAGMLVHAMMRMREAKQDAPLFVATRLDWLIGLTATTGILAVAEWAARTYRPLPDPGSLEFFDRGLALQGVLPPISTLMAAFVVYILYHALLARRLVALQELWARLVVVTAAALVLVLAHTLTLWWVEITRFPLHSSFLLLLVSALFLSVYNGLHRGMLALATAWVNPSGQDLRDALTTLRAELRRAVDAQTMATRLVDELFASRRFASVGVWLRDEHDGAYHHAAYQGDQEPLQTLADGHLTHGVPRGIGWLRPEDGLPLLEIVGAAAVFPLRGDGELIGWLALNPADDSDGLSPDELRQVRAAADLAELVLSNVASFRRIAEARRLATLGAMSAGLAHEIRNPLAGLKGAAQVLQDEDLDGESKEMLDVIVTEANRLDRVVSDFLSFSRPFALDHEPVDVGAMLQHVATLVGAEADGPHISVDLAEDLPVLYADEMRLEQVVLNLVRNAVDATGREGQITLRAFHPLPSDGVAVGIDVVDDGPGIPEDVREHLFTPFFTTKPHGTGLGLPISRRIVEAHGGRLTARANSGGGTTFEVMLPPRAPDQASVSVEAPSMGAAGKAPAPGTKRELS